MMKYNSFIFKIRTFMYNFAGLFKNIFFLFTNVSLQLVL
jgi:hypothetical protein